MRVLGVIPARGGSKGVPGKNLRTLGGRPLLAYSVDAAQGSCRLGRVVLSTDDPAVADTGRRLGVDVPFMRPAHLAIDEAPMLPVLMHAVDEMRAQGFDADAVAVLQPTSPLRRAEHIDAAVDLLVATAADAVVTVVEVPHQFAPASLLQLEGNRLTPVAETPMVLQRQRKPRVYARNGPAVLVVRAAQLRAGSLYGGDTRGLVMTPEDSVDVDTPWDFDLLEFLLAKQRTVRPHVQS